MINEQLKQGLADPGLQAWLGGASDRVRLGGYGGTVHLEIVAGNVRIRRPSGRRMQKVLGPDSPARRYEAAEVALGALPNIREQMQRRRKLESGSEEGDSFGRPLTLGQVWVWYLESLCPGFAHEHLRWGAREVKAHLRTLRPAARAMFSVDSVLKVLDCARRLARYPGLGFGAEVRKFEPGHLVRYRNSAIAKGYSTHTVLTDLRRLRSAIRYVMRHHPSAWGDLEDPTAGHGLVDGLGSERRGEVEAWRIPLLVEAAESRGYWRLVAAILLIAGTGRRVGAVGADRGRQHMDVLPLTGEDLIRSDDGALRVVFRAQAQKGLGFGRQDVIIPFPSALRPHLDRALIADPNPMGGAHPLLWSPSDPRRPITHSALASQFKRAWGLAFPGDPRPRFVAFQSICRMVVTTLGTGLGAEYAANFTGRTLRVVMEWYLVGREEDRAVAADLLSRDLGPRFSAR